jgi:hypothetical protein
MNTIAEFETQPYRAGGHYAHPTPVDIKKFEKCIKHSIPPDYAAFLQKWNGGYPQILFTPLRWVGILD